MSELRQLPLWQSVKIGLLGGAVALYLCLIGMIEVFGRSDIIERVISLGQVLLLLSGLGAGYLAARRVGEPTDALTILSNGVVAGGITGGLLTGLVIIGSMVNLRAVFINASPALYTALTLGAGPNGAWIPLVGGAALGLLAALFYLLPPRVRQPLMNGLLGVLLAGLFAGLLRVILAARPGWSAELGRFLFASEGLTLAGASLFFILAGGLTLLWSQSQATVRERITRLPEAQRKTLRWTMLGLAVILILILPQVSGAFIAQVIVLVGIFALMGLGLNITLGMAGLFDLGFVAFFAISAYTVGLLTSTGEHGIAQWSWWAAAPVGVLLAMIAGAFFGLPVLGIRGDYLAIATLGFGEIVRLLVGSDFLRPWLGGSFGILAIPKPWIGNLELAGPQQIYYLAVFGAMLVAFVAVRLRDSRLGRAWMAIREDEDVAEALGVNLVQTKLLAYMLGGAFAGLGGAIFAALVGSIFPHSMNLLVSVNVVALLIVGGMGSIPGVIVGALALIGLPELFREFAEYRYLLYGVALIVMMLAKPEGLWPSAAIRRELHTEEINEVETNPDSSGAVPAS